MAHWLEETENKINSKNNSHSETKEKIEAKKNDISTNTELISSEYKALINDFDDIIERINKLPKDDRIPFGFISMKKKSSKLQNSLYKIHSSRRILIKEYSGIFSPFKTNHYKNSRLLFISIAREKGKVLLEHKEIKSKRVRIVDKEDEKKSILNIFKKKTKQENQEVKNVKAFIDIKEFNHDYLLKQIDWLAFKDDGNQFFRK